MVAGRNSLSNQSVEREILDAFPVAREVVLHGDDAERRVSAQFLVDLLLAKDGTGRRPGLKLSRALISGDFDLESSAVDVGIMLRECRFESKPNLTDARLRSLRLPGTALPGLEATNLRVSGNLELNEGFESHGEVTLLGAHIGGDLRMAGAVLDNYDENDAAARAMVASRLTVDGALLARDLEARGQLRFISARVDGLMSFAGAKLYNPGRVAFQGERLQVGESLFFQRDCIVDGRVILQNATINGGVDALGSTFRSPGSGATLQMARARVGRNVSLKEAKIEGTVALRAADVGGDVTFADSTLDSDEGKVLAQGLRTNTLNLRWAKEPFELDLGSARLQVIEDDEMTWP